MSSETVSAPETTKQAWLKELAKFLGEAAESSWATDVPQVKDSETGEKRIIFTRDEWTYIDSCHGYFSAFGANNVYQHNKLVWSMNYGGQGQLTEHYDEAPQTFEFLKEALQHFDQELPIRGPKFYPDHTVEQEPGSFTYTCLTKGDLERGEWHEWIYVDEGKYVVDPYFQQSGTFGVIIDRDDQGNPAHPWDLTE
jgi:hypothetical protein